VSQRTAARAIAARTRALLVDSSAWIALMNARDGQHATATRLFARALEERLRLLTTNLILAEVHRFLLHRVGIAAAAVFLDHLEESPSLEIRFAGERQHRGARRWLARLAHQRLTYTDAVSFAFLEESRGVAPLTFDRDFAVAGFTPWAG
jgi:predicted nucleic acid-binding protein